jgi:hypothetical protein
MNNYMDLQRSKTSDFIWTEIIQTIHRLNPIFQQLEVVSGELGWRQLAGGVELYRNKLKITMSQTVVVAVLGGVKAGKSTVFQTLCHDTHVAVTGVEHLTFRPLAFSRKKLEPAEFTMADLFPEFDLQITANPQSATRQSEPANRLWWMTSEEITQGVVIVDCPDLNSLNEINRDLAFRLAKSCDIVFLVMLGGANAYAADIKYFARDALNLGRQVVPVLTQMDDEKSARIVLEEFKREMAPLLAGQIPKFPFAFYVPVVPPQHRTDLRKIRLRPLNEQEFVNLDDAAVRSQIKAEVWNHSYQQFKKQLAESLSEINIEANAWCAFWPRIETVVANWGEHVARIIFPRSLVLRELLSWYEETRLTHFRKVMRLINPVNWPSQLYNIWRRRQISQHERQELKQRVTTALEKLQSQLDAEANQAWVKIWGKEKPSVPDALAHWIANHLSNPLGFTGSCNQQVQQSLVKPYLSQEWRAAFRADLERWWVSPEENARQKRRILEFSQLTVDFISWLALPATFFFPGSLDTLIVGMAQPVLTFINQHFLFIESHFSGAREHWVELEGRRLKNQLIATEANLALLQKHVQKWQEIRQALHELDRVLREIDQKIKPILALNESI